MESKQGILYLVATPIGNLEDISYRAVRILKEADRILAEDTRTSAVLLNAYDVHTPATSYHEHNKRSKLPVILSWLREGQVLAQISDAGTPGISDPGEELVEACAKEGIPVYSIPGPVAAVCALTSSGLPSGRFAFEAFLPKKKKTRKRVLDELKRESRTIIIYESPHHLLSTLKELRQVLGDRRIALCRELTKKFEEKRITTLSEAVSFYEQNDPRGEFVVVISKKTDNDGENYTKDIFGDITIAEHVGVYERRQMGRKEAIKAVAEARGIRKREVYEEMIKEE